MPSRRTLFVCLAVTALAVVLPRFARADDVSQIIQKMRQLKNRNWRHPQPRRRAQPQEPSQKGSSEETLAEVRAEDAAEQKKLDKLYALADAACRKGDHVTALRYAKQALAISGSDDAKVYLQRVHALVILDQADHLKNEGKDEAALAQYHRALGMWKGALTPKGKDELKEFERYVAADKYRTALMEDMTDYDKSEKARIAKARPKAEALIAKAGDLITHGAYREALSKAKEALKVLPADPHSNAVYWFADANVAFEDGNLDETIHALREALALQPNNESAKHALDLALARRRSAAHAMKTALAAVQSRLEIRGSAHDTGLVDPRVAAYASLPRQAEAVVHSPGYPEAKRGFQAIAKDDWVLASACYRSALFKDPDNPALKRMVDLTSYMVERRKREAADRSARRTGKPTAKGPKIADVMRILEQTPGPGVPKAALAKAGAVVDDMYVKETNGWMAEDSAKSAMSELESGDRVHALQDLRTAVALAPWVPAYRLAIDELTAPKGERPASSAKARKTLGFLEK